MAKKKTDEEQESQPATGACEICKQHYGSATCLAPDDPGHGPRKEEKAKDKEASESRRTTLVSRHPSLSPTG